MIQSKVNITSIFVCITDYWLKLAPRNGYTGNSQHNHTQVTRGPGRIRFTRVSSETSYKFEMKKERNPEKMYTNYREIYRGPSGSGEVANWTRTTTCAWEMEGRLSLWETSPRCSVLWIHLLSHCQGVGRLLDVARSLAIVECATIGSDADDTSSHPRNTWPLNTTLLPKRRIQIRRLFMVLLKRIVGHL